MHNQESLQANETYEILWDFDIQTYHLIQPRRPDLVLISKTKKELAIVWILMFQRTTE